MNKEDRGLSADDSTTTDSHPLNNIIIGEKNGSNLIQKSIRLERRNFSIYLSENIWEGWKKYCLLSGCSHASINESALIEYMQRHPVAQVNLNVTRDLTDMAPKVKDRIRNKVLKDKIRSTMGTLNSIRESGRGNQHSFRSQLQKLLLQATNLRRPDTELMELIEEAEALL